VIDPNSRVDLIFYSGINCSGAQQIMRIFPGGEKGAVDDPFQSMKMVAGKGLRVYLCTSTDEEHWKEKPWRCLRVLKGVGAKTGTRRAMLRVHDLDLYNDAHANRLPVDGEQAFMEVASPDDGEGWTFGRGAGRLKNRIRMIRTEKEPV